VGDAAQRLAGHGIEQVDAIGRGRVFTGAQALDNGLVDVLGGFDTALDEAKKLASAVGPSCPLYEMSWATSFD
jgi:ClpP class serine protease